MAKRPVETTFCTLISPVGFRKEQWFMCPGSPASRSPVPPLLCDLGKSPLSELICVVGIARHQEEGRRRKIVALAGSLPSQSCWWQVPHPRNATRSQVLIDSPPFQFSPRGIFSKPGTDLGTPQVRSMQGLPTVITANTYCSGSAWPCS